MADIDTNIEISNHGIYSNSIFIDQTESEATKYKWANIENDEQM